MTETEPGLRELKKRMTRASIATATLRLVEEKGVAQVTIEEIAHDAIVSPRTVSNYFMAKEQAIVVAGSPDWDSLIDHYRDTPAGEHPLTALRDLALDAVRSMGAEALARDRRVLELAAEHETLQPFLTAEYDELAGRLTDAVATHLDLDAATDTYPRLVASVAAAALLTAQRLWAERQDASSDALIALIGEGFDRCAAGLPSPQLA